MWNNPVTGPGNRPVAQVIAQPLPPADPTVMPVVPPELDFEDAEALASVRHTLTQAPALQAWCVQAFDGVNAEQVRDDVITLLFYTHFDGGPPPGAALEARDTVLMRVAPHLSLTGQAALRQSLDVDAPPHTAPNPFAELLTQRDRWFLEGLVCRQHGEACLLRGESVAAGGHFKRAATSFAQVPEQTTRAADSARRAGHAYAKANRPATAVHQLVHASTLELTLALALHGRANPLPRDALACRAAFTRATYDFVAAAALYRTMQLPGLALALDTQAAQAFLWLAMFPQAAGRHTQIGDTWTDIAAAYQQGGDTAQAEAAAARAVLAYRAAAHAHWAGQSYAAAGEALVKARDFVAAAEAFAKAGRHHSAGQCYLWAARRNEAGAHLHQRAQRPELATATFQLALTYYALASTEFQKAARAYRHAHQEVASAVCLREGRAALELSMRAQLPPATP
ncbi:hypothetical protein [Pandoraea sputorum]|uniref:Uncharacterized protein n=1 Tax=Pandoraea sputorum TaxID=93222 RepID=A0A5E5BJ16_9BURK|nr:hypothetical protein [Pandoraea sputorum]VVE85859.1 hypothetical protein PSP31121_05492 [Pandoraea sputorum]